METRDRDALAGLLRKAASQTIPESQFWVEFNALAELVKEPIMKVALDAASNFWHNFHRKKVLFVIPVRPNRSELRQGRDELNLIAAVLETGWRLPLLAEPSKAKNL
jgi:hypothetical protein